MDQFYQELADKVKDAVEKDMRKVLDEVGSEKIYAVALVTDSDCVTLFLAVNTLEYLRENGGLESEGRWLPDEWGYSDGDDSELAKLSELLYEHDETLSSEDDDDEKLEERWQMFFEAVISALRQLKEDNVFGENSEEITCFVSVSDDDRAEEVENHSAEQLNAPELVEVFLKRNIEGEYDSDIGI